MSVNSLMEAPQDVRKILVRYLDDCWFRNWEEKRASTEEAAQDLIKERAGYLLRMYWLGRKDKFRSDLMPVFEWVTRSFVPAETQARYTDLLSRKREFGEILFVGENYNSLEQGVMAGLYAAYKATPGVELPPPAPAPVKRGWLDKLFGRGTEDSMPAPRGMGR